MTDVLPVAIIGAGPVGLAAAAHLVERGFTPLVLEAGPGVGTALRDWAHVRVFSPWSLNIDAAAGRLLAATGWAAPNEKAVPTGGEIVGRYLEPLAALPQIAPHIRYGARVTAVVRHGIDKMTDAGRAQAPFELRWTQNGQPQSALAQAVIDASGTWATPNPMGADGLPVAGEAENAAHIRYGIPDVGGAERARYAGRRVLVVGSGHSAINVVLDLLRLQAQAPETHVTWALRRNRLERLLGGGLNDQLPERGALGMAAKAAIDAGKLDLIAPFAATRVSAAGIGLLVQGMLDGAPHQVGVDEIIVATGLRPDLGLMRELRVALDPSVEAPPALAPLIDPNLHSCGSVPPHGARELAHPEPGFYIVGSKSYGRAPTFLMATGYEQVRSVVAAIAGDMEAAHAVHLVLPETGVCNTQLVAAEASCCGTPAAKPAPKPAAAQGCGCSAAPQPAAAEA